MTDQTNIAQRLTAHARRAPHQRAIVMPVTSRKTRKTEYREVTFAELDENTNRIAAGLLNRGLKPGMKLVLFVPFGIDFIQLTFALLKAGATLILIDPGMGRKNVFRCLSEVEPDGFVAIPVVHWMRLFAFRKFSSARFNVSVGMRLPGTIATHRELLKTPADSFQSPIPRSNDAAAVIFTSGSTGPPKGVRYEHGMFTAQVDLIQQFYGIEPGEVDLPGFPLFGLFNAAMGVTTVIPEMDPTRPAQVDPQKIVRDIEQQQATQAFGSPAFWNRVGRYCEQHSITLPTLKRTLSAGGPVPVHVLERMSRVLSPQASFHTPYGATESLPVASISAKEVLEETSLLTRNGKGTCVGRTFPAVRVKIIPITQGPIASLNDVGELPAGEIGEIITNGPSITREYFVRPEATLLAKIPDGEQFWHRMGDVGYLDEEGRLWFCGRKAHIVETEQGRMFSVCCEAIVNEHPRVYRSALVGVGEAPSQLPVFVVEPEEGQVPKSPDDEEDFRQELLERVAQHPLTSHCRHILFHKSLPVDTRHNVKIDREALGKWAAEHDLTAFHR